MTLFAYALLSATTSLALAPVDPVDFAQLTIRQRIIIRVPAARPEPPPRLLRWRERRGPKCLPMNTVGGAAIVEADSVDLYLRGGIKMRAKLDEACPALDYYSGFYISPTKDGMICADRDAIRTRAGGTCGIDRFRTLAVDR